MTCILCEWLSRQHIESIHQSNLLVFVMIHANFRLGTLRTLSIATLPHIIATHAHAHAHTHARTHTHMSMVWHCINKCLEKD